MFILFSPEDKKCKPKRPCPFCELYFADLRGHLMGPKHKDKEEVKRIQELQKEEQKLEGKEQELARKKRLAEIDNLRKLGILKENKKILSTNVVLTSSQLLCERVSEGAKVKCSKCSGFFNEKYFSRHGDKCLQNVNTDDDSQFATATSETYKDDIKTDQGPLLNNMKKDDIFDIIKSDPTLTHVGKVLIENAKPKKTRRARNKARETMRRLARLKKITGLKQAADLFCTDNMGLLEEAISEMTQSEEKQMKAGLKVALGIMIKEVCGIYINLYICQHNEAKVKQVKEFREVFSSRTYYGSVFGTAEYQLIEKSQKQTRLPKSLPKEEDHHFLMGKLEGEVQKIVQNGITTTAQYVWARRVSYVYSTLLNGKRGNETSLLEVKDWLNRDQWVNKYMVTTRDQHLLADYAIVFFMGKIRKRQGLVPMIFPKAIHTLMDLLCDKDVRKVAHVRETNEYIFAYTESAEPVLGYNEINCVCKVFGISTITFTANRHRHSTQFWNIPNKDEEQITLFLEAMGHDLETDKGTYQCPPALKMLATVPKLLETIKQVCFLNVSHHISERGTLE